MSGGRQMRRRDCVVGLAATVIGLPGRAFSQQASDPRYVRVSVSGGDGQFAFSDNRLSVRVDVRDMPLGEILRHLLNNIPADIKWMDPALERQPTTGSFNGPIANVVRQLLRGTNFMVAYSDKGAVTRVIVLGNGLCR